MVQRAKRFRLLQRKISVGENNLIVYVRLQQEHQRDPLTPCSAWGGVRTARADGLRTVRVDALHGQLYAKL